MRRAVGLRVARAGLWLAELGQRLAGAEDVPLPLELWVLACETSGAGALERRVAAAEAEIGTTDATRGRDA